MEDMKLSGWPQTFERKCTYKFTHPYKHIYTHIHTHTPHTHKYTYLHIHKTINKTKTKTTRYLWCVINADTSVLHVFNYLLLNITRFLLSLMSSVKLFPCFTPQTDVHMFFRVVWTIGCLKLHLPLSSYSPSLSLKIFWIFLSYFNCKDHFLVYTTFFWATKPLKGPERAATKQRSGTRGLDGWNTCVYVYKRIRIDFPLTMFLSKSAQAHMSVIRTISAHSLFKTHKKQLLRQQRNSIEPEGKASLMSYDGVLHSEHPKVKVSRQLDVYQSCTFVCQSSQML